MPNCCHITVSAPYHYQYKHRKSRDKNSSGRYRNGDHFTCISGLDEHAHIALILFYELYILYTILDFYAKKAHSKYMNSANSQDDKVIKCTDKK